MVLHANQAYGLMTSFTLQALQCIDFNDFEPGLTIGKLEGSADGAGQLRALVNDPLFGVDQMTFADGQHIDSRGFGLEIIGVLEGRIAIGDLVRRFPEMELAEGEVRWRDTITLRGLSSLPVKLGDTAAKPA